MNTKEMSAYLQFRTIDPEKNRTIVDNFPGRIPVHSSIDLEYHLKQRVMSVCDGGGGFSSQWWN